MRSVLSVLCTCLLVASLLLGCAGLTTEAQRTPVPKDLLEVNIDAMGNKVHTIEGELAIVSTAPSATEILFALGCGEKIVGIDVYSTYPPETSKITVVGDFNGFDIEKVIALEPNVVFAGNGLQHQDIAALENAGLYVVAAEATYYEDIENSIALIGTVVGRQQQAAALIAQLNNAERAAREKANELKTAPAVYYVMSTDGWTSGKGSFINGIIEMSGGICVTADTEREWPQYPIEQLVLKDPDILLVSSWITEDDLKSAPGYKDLTAIKNGNYYFVNSDIIERPGPRVAEALATLSDIFINYEG
ncbi:MAG: helical backbone metal receptor [Christensenellales bacterium]